MKATVVHDVGGSDGVSDLRYAIVSPKEAVVLIWLKCPTKATVVHDVGGPGAPNQLPLASTSPKEAVGRQCKPVVPGGELSVLSRGIHTSAQHPFTSNVSIFELPKECIPQATASPVYFPLRHRRPSHIRLVINGLDPQSHFEDSGDPNK
ncbi:hypothetical protein B0H10DRAFT_2241253 [Mycena sp. CBHHK59/15]|nr:hypothetical protein B0H10DRAFT_2241253 [Mycena sp. CBHHK59/15]